MCNKVALARGSVVHSFGALKWLCARGSMVNYVALCERKRGAFLDNKATLCECCNSVRNCGKSMPSTYFNLYNKREFVGEGNSWIARAVCVTFCLFLTLQL